MPSTTSWVSSRTAARVEQLTYTRLSGQFASRARKRRAATAWERLPGSWHSKLERAQYELSWHGLRKLVRFGQVIDAGCSTKVSYTATTIVLMCAHEWYWMRYKAVHITQNQTSRLTLGSTSCAILCLGMNR
jgi:hypothetical protein